MTIRALRNAPPLPSIAVSVAITMRLARGGASRETAWASEQRPKKNRHAVPKRTRMVSIVSDSIQPNEATFLFTLVVDNDYVPLLDSAESSPIRKLRAVQSPHSNQ